MIDDSADEASIRAARNRPLSKKLKQLTPPPLRPKPAFKHLFGEQSSRPRTQVDPVRLAIAKLSFADVFPPSSQGFPLTNYR